MRKRGKRENNKKIGENENELSDFDTQKNEILEELRNVNHKDLKDLVYRMQLFYNGIIDVLDLEYIPTKGIGYSLNPGIYEIEEINNTLKHILPDNVKGNVTFDDIRLKSNLKFNQTLTFTEKSFFYTIIGFTQSHQGPLNDIEGFYQILPGSYQSKKSINIIGIDKVHLKCDCIQASIVNGKREPILFSFARNSIPGYKYIKNQK